MKMTNKEAAKSLLQKLEEIEASYGRTKQSLIVTSNGDGYVYRSPEGLEPDVDDIVVEFKAPDFWRTLMGLQGYSDAVGNEFVIFIAKLVKAARSAPS